MGKHHPRKSSGMAAVWAVLIVMLLVSVVVWVTT